MKIPDPPPYSQGPQAWWPFKDGWRAGWEAGYRQACKDVKTIQLSFDEGPRSD